MGNQLIQSLITRQPFCRRLRSTLRHPRNIIRGIPHQSEIINDLLRVDIKLLLHPLTIQHRISHGVNQAHLGIHQLCQILIPSRDHHRPTLSTGLTCQSANHIIRLHPRHTQQRQAQSLHQLMQRRNLLTQLIRHRRTVSLILSIEIITKGLTLGIKHHRHMTRLIGIEQATQHIHHAIDGPRRLTRSIR